MNSTIGNLYGIIMLTLTLPLPSFSYPHLLPSGVGDQQTPCCLKNPWLHEREVLYGIRNITERLKNVKVCYIVTMITPQWRRALLRELLDFSNIPKATKSTILTLFHLGGGGRVFPRPFTHGVDKCRGTKR